MAASPAFEVKLNALLAEANYPPLDSVTAGHFEDYCVLLQRWNARTNLTAIRDEDGILRRHFLECIAAARALPIHSGTLLDFGSGAGFPGIPVALCQPEMHVTLAESQGKKAAFLREAVRVLELSTQVYSDRAEKLGKTFDCVTLRAVDRMDEAVEGAVRLVRPEGWLALLTTTGTQASFQLVAGPEFSWSAPVQLPGGEDRILLFGQKCA
jgi:16S rRNA (guanine527-N7)-methyltransferase